MTPAVEDARLARPSEAFERLQRETDELTQEPTGVGLDVPGWLQALENEVRKARHNHTGRESSPGSQWLVGPASAGDARDRRATGRLGTRAALRRRWRKP